MTNAAPCKDRRHTIMENLPKFESSGRFINLRILEIARMLERYSFDEKSLDLIEQEVAQHQAKYDTWRESLRRS